MDLSPSPRIDSNGDRDWRALFSRFEAIAVVANSPAVDLDDVRRRCPAATLYVFFNSAFRVVEGRFDQDALLVARSGNYGASIVRDGDIHSIVRRFEPSRFHGVVNLRAAGWETLEDVEKLKPIKATHLDLVADFQDAYTAGKAASSGFAIAVWLSKLDLGLPIYLAGFTGTRSEKWKVFDAHDWTFEQVALRLLVRKGSLSPLEGDRLSAPPSLERIGAIVPSATAEEIALVASEVLSDRVDNLGYFIDRLWSITKIARFFNTLVAYTNPKKRQRMAKRR